MRNKGVWYALLVGVLLVCLLGTLLVVVVLRRQAGPGALQATSASTQHTPSLLAATLPASAAAPTPSALPPQVTPRTQLPEVTIVSQKVFTESQQTELIQLAQEPLVQDDRYRALLDWGVQSNYLDAAHQPLAAGETAYSNGMTLRSVVYTDALRTSYILAMHFNLPGEAKAVSFLGRFEDKRFRLFHQEAELVFSEEGIEVHSAPGPLSGSTSDRVGARLGLACPGLASGCTTTSQDEYDACMERFYPGYKTWGYLAMAPDTFLAGGTAVGIGILLSNPAGWVIAAGAFLIYIGDAPIVCAGEAKDDPPQIEVVQVVDTGKSYYDCMGQVLRRISLYGYFVKVTDDRKPAPVTNFKPQFELRWGEHIDLMAEDCNGQKTIRALTGGPHGRGVVYLHTFCDREGKVCEERAPGQAECVTKRAALPEEPAAEEALRTISGSFEDPNLAEYTVLENSVQLTYLESGGAVQDADGRLHITRLWPYCKEKPITEDVSFTFTFSGTFDADTASFDGVTQSVWSGTEITNCSVTPNVSHSMAGVWQATLRADGTVAGQLTLTSVDSKAMESSWPLSFTLRSAVQAWLPGG